VGTPREVFPHQRLSGEAPTVADLTTVAGTAANAAAASAVRLVEGIAPDRTFAMWLREWGLHFEVVAALTAGVIAAFSTQARPLVALLALLTWMFGSYHSGRAVTTPLTRQLKTVCSSALFPLAALAAGVGFFGLSAGVVPQAFAALGAAAATAAIFRTLRWRLQAPVRVVMVGDRASVATATTTWARTTNVRIVGGLISEPGLDREAVPNDILGVPTVQGLDSVQARVQGWEADLIVVDPGAGISSDDFRRLTWALEGTRCAVGVSGVLSSVAPHRIDPGGLGHAGITGVRPPRPSSVVRGLKGAFDRIGGAVLLVLASPVLLAMVLAVRIDTRGPALFTQTRIGKRGKPFKVYKMRTMVADAEKIKEQLSEVNEFDSVLFKMKRDPRITRVGQFLRTSSLDELPQLVNVVRGDMSLVGPRPFLPQEVAHMDEDTLRRHAVKPGITGLWQVSGRSDLPWNEAAALDTYYADNWSLTGDLAIGMRTVKAVVDGKGAY